MLRPRPARSRASLVAAACCALAGLGPACGGSKAVSDRPAANDAQPRWEDAFEAMPELLVVVRPNALRRDAVYGPLVRSAFQALAARNRAAEATRPMEAFEGADEVLIGMSGRGDEAEAVLVVRGVRADLDPARMTGEGGQPLWRPVPASGGARRVAELSRTEHGVDAALFVLPGRTWVIASGPARGRVREAFASRSGRPALVTDPQAPLSVRIHGPRFIERTRALRPGGPLSNVGRRLSSLTLALQPGSQGAVTVTFTYEDEDSAAFAEVTLNHVLERIRQNDDPSVRARFAWTQRARVERDVRAITVRAQLPGDLLERMSRMPEEADVSPELPTP